MISDFFYPNFGGVENHIYYLSQCLIALGHRVIILTHTYSDRQGIRHLPAGLKVYHLPFANMALQTTYPTLFFSLPFYYDLFIRERVDLVHGHSAFSTMCHEGILHARTLGLPCVFTDHSLFGFADISSILTNKLLKYTLSDVGSIICVSNTSKENTVLRGAFDPSKVFVIPNAINSDQFYPRNLEIDPEPSNLTIVILCRLVYRKGIDLLIDVIPSICQEYPHISFLIAGDGPKKVDLEQMRERHQLHSRVKMIGSVPAESVRSVLIQGHIFLNTSLTEAFCMAIVEAAACGLYVVSTSVGGIPEVLPEHMISLSDPNSTALRTKLADAIDSFPNMDTKTFHSQVSSMYSWSDVTERTNYVYQTISNSPPDLDTPLLERLRRVWGCGQIAGKFLCITMIWNHIFLYILRILNPPDLIEPAMDIFK